MKEITAYQCETCGRVIVLKEAAQNHEEACRWERLGHAIWYENDGLHHSAKVPSELFGPHEYDRPGTPYCRHGCGCWVGDARSGGSVDPFGPCPRNPKMADEGKGD